MEKLTEIEEIINTYGIWVKKCLRKHLLFKLWQRCEDGYSQIASATKFANV